MRPADRSPHNVGDRVDRTDLVEMDFADRGSMNVGFSFTETGKDADCQVLFGDRQLACRNHVGDVMQVTVRMFRLVPHMHLGGSEAPAVYLFDFKSTAG